jgi:hypothetical protein
VEEAIGARLEKQRGGRCLWEEPTLGGGARGGVAQWPVGKEVPNVRGEDSGTARGEVTRRPVKEMATGMRAEWWRCSGRGGGVVKIST